MRRAHLILLAVLAVRPAGAQTTPELPTGRLERLSGAIRVDGRLDDAAWSAIVPLTAFVQEEPEEGVAGSERTEVRVARDELAIYVAARMHDRQPVSVALGRRDGGAPSDWFGFELDSRHDHRSAYGFSVNPAGVRTDYRVNESEFDRTWDAVWEAAATVDSAGWTVEMRIPLSQLRFAPGTAEWGMQINRWLRRREESAVWAFTPRDQRGGPVRFGHLQGTGALAMGPRLEASPYTVARSEHVEHGANPYRGDAEVGASVGVDLKYRVTGTLTLDATLNPDFGTVEQDPAQLNLGASELELAERRPFFTEGADVFEFGRGATGFGSLNRRLVYPRRIGRRPQIGGPAGADRPDASTILGAAKLAGLLPGGWTVGVLDAVTQEERVRWLDSAGEPRGAMAEPLTNYFAGRAVRQWRGGASWLGLMGTSVRRRLDEQSASVLRGSASVLGLDGSHEWAGRAWRLSGYAVGSRVAGTEAALLRSQTSPVRYLQRPDAPHLAVDSAATSMAGWSAQLQLTRQAGRHWLGDAWVSATSPGYEVNDLGFAVRSDLRTAGGRLIYQENEATGPFRRFSLTGHLRADFNGAGDRLWAMAFAGTDWTTRGYWHLVLNGAAILPRVDDRATRGGPLTTAPGEGRLFALVETDPRRAVTGAGSVFVRRLEDGGELDAWAQVAYRPSPRWSVSLRPAVDVLRSDAHYIGQAADPTATATFGRRYLFADLRQTTASLETRLDYVFTPDLSLQLFARPYVTAGSVRGYKALTRPRSHEWSVFGEGFGTARPLVGGRWGLDADGDGPAPETVVGESLGQSDFIVRTLRGSAVLRWEWRAGSTLYLAWQQARDDETRDRGVFRPRRDGAALLGSAPDNVFILKLSYWLNR